jgi:pilus assembly protein Flp/PilA
MPRKDRTTGPTGKAKEAVNTSGIWSKHMKNIFARFAKDESGATAIEYGLIAGLVSVVIIGVLGTMSDSLKNIFSDISSALSTADAQ